MRHALNLIASQFLQVPKQSLIDPESEKKRSKLEDMTYLFCAWERLRYVHTASIHAQLV
jgi:hypothetical protein